MPFIKTIKRWTAKLDLFYSNQILRYNQDSQYKTFVGGVISAIIMFAILFSFSDMIISTIQRTSINSKLETIKQSDPPQLEIVPGKDSMFMFGIQIASMDLTYIADLINSPKIFDVFMTVTTITNGAYTNDQIFPLEQCTKQHWRMMPSIIQDQRFNAYGISNWLCPKLDSVIKLKGHYTSQENIMMKIQVYQCKNQTSNNSCATKQEINQIFEEYTNFYLSYYYINPVINPNKPQFMSYYLEGDDYIIISRNIGCQALLHLSEYTINSDNSILPFQDIQQEKGVIILKKSQRNMYSVTNSTPLSYVYITRSPNSIFYTRQVLKISQVISYIGGFIGAITALLFLVKIYTDCSLQMNIGLKIFSKNMKSDIEEQTPKSFNILNFIKQNFYNACRKVKIIQENQWKYCKIYEDYQNQIIRQLDIKLILKRIIMLQTSITYLFDEYQLEGIKNQAQISCQKAKQLREAFIKSAFYTRQINKQKTQKNIKSIRQLQNINKVSNEHPIITKNIENNTPCPLMKQISISSQQTFNSNIINRSENSNNSINNSFMNKYNQKDSVVNQNNSNNSKIIKKFQNIQNKTQSFNFQQISDFCYDIQQKRDQVNNQKPIENIVYSQNLLEYVDVKNLLQLKMDAQKNLTSFKIWNNLNQKIKNAIESLLTTKRTKKKVCFK